MSRLAGNFTFFRRVWVLFIYLLTWMNACVRACVYKYLVKTFACRWFHSIWPCSLSIRRGCLSISYQNSLNYLLCYAMCYVLCVFVDCHHHHTKPVLSWISNLYSNRYWYEYVRYHTHVHHETCHTYLSLHTCTHAHPHIKPYWCCCCCCYWML